jgi:hypothetical protein
MGWAPQGSKHTSLHLFILTLRNAYSEAPLKVRYRCQGLNITTNIFTNQTI